MFKVCIIKLLICNICIQVSDDKYSLSALLYARIYLQQLTDIAYFFKFQVVYFYISHQFKHIMLSGCCTRLTYDTSILLIRCTKCIFLSSAVCEQMQGRVKSYGPHCDFKLTSNYMSETLSNGSL